MSTSLQIDEQKRRVLVHALRGHRSWLGGKYVQGDTRWEDVKLVDEMLESLEGPLDNGTAAPADDGSDLA